MNITFFYVVINYEKTLEKMLAAYQFDRVDSRISAWHLSIHEHGKVALNIGLFQYDTLMESGDIIWDLDSRGLRPATLPELLAFGSTYPEKQLSFPIIALGSVKHLFPAVRLVASLSRDGSKRELSLNSWGGILGRFAWTSFYRFAAICK